MQQYERWDQLEYAMEAVNNQLQSRIWTKLPCIVVKVYADGQHVDLQPAVQALQRVVAPNGKVTFVNVTLPILPMVPIKFPSGGGYTLTFPVSVNDEGTVSFSSRCIDNWWLLGGVQPSLAPNSSGSKRQHSLSDGFFELGGRSKPNLLANVNQSATQLRSDDGTCYMQFTSSGFQVVFPGGSFKVDSSGNATATGNVTAGFGGSDQADLQNHTHKVQSVEPGSATIITTAPVPGS